MMKVLIVGTGEIREHTLAAALRKIEQGKAVPVRDAPRPAARRERPKGKTDGDAR